MARFIAYKPDGTFLNGDCYLGTAIQFITPNGYAGVLGPLDESDPIATDAFEKPNEYTVQNGVLVHSNPPTDERQLDATKQARIAYLELQYASTLVKGFSSSALGTPYTYGLSDDDEKEWKALNVALTRGAYPPGGYALKCWGSTGAVQYIVHTQAQAEQVLVDGTTFGLNQLTNLRTKINDVNAVQLANYSSLQDAENAVYAVAY